MKRLVKLSFCDFWSGFNKEEFILTKALKQHHSVEIVDNPEEADYVMFSIFGNRHWFLPDHIIKIFYTGENVFPDFNACDYAVGFEYLEIQDRYLRLPNNYCTPFFVNTTLLMENRVLPTDPCNRHFCSFVVSNSNANPIRQSFFEKLSTYKSVDSGGRFMNNIGGPVDDKISFHAKHKFVICFENSSHPGYTTEKIFDAFAAGAIPIYWGDPKVTTVFNPSAFVDVTTLGVEKAIELIKKLDQDDDAYLRMINAPVLLHPEQDNYQAKFQQAVEFVDSIVNQELSEAVRYNRDFWGKKIVEQQKDLIQRSNQSFKSCLFQKIKKLF